MKNSKDEQQALAEIVMLTDEFCQGGVSSVTNTFFPADRQKPKPKSYTGPKIIEFPSKKSKNSMQKSSQEMRGDAANLFEGTEK